jgi:hypothetical protein
MVKTTQFNYDMYYPQSLITEFSSVENVKSILTDAKAFPSASPVCELPAAFPLVPGDFKQGKKIKNFSRIVHLFFFFLGIFPLFQGCSLLLLHICHSTPGNTLCVVYLINCKAKFLTGFCIINENEVCFQYFTEKYMERYRVHQNPPSYGVGRSVNPEGSPRMLSAPLMGGVCEAATYGELLVLLRWKLDIGGRLVFMSVGETECGG